MSGSPRRWGCARAGSDFSAPMRGRIPPRAQWEPTRSPLSEPAWSRRDTLIPPAPAQTRPRSATLRQSDRPPPYTQSATRFDRSKSRRLGRPPAQRPIWVANGVQPGRNRKESTYRSRRTRPSRRPTRLPRSPRRWSPDIHPANSPARPRWRSNKIQIHFLIFSSCNWMDYLYLIDTNVTYFECMINLALRNKWKIYQDRSHREISFQWHLWFLEYLLVFLYSIEFMSGYFQRLQIKTYKWLSDSNE